MTAPFVSFPPPADVDAAELCAAIVRAAGPRELTDVHHPAASLTPNNPAHQAIYDHLLGYVVAAAPMLGVNDLGNFGYCKLLEYQGPEEGMDWHHDVGVRAGGVYVGLGMAEQWQIDEMNGRRVSISMQLSDPASYVGGDLEIMTDLGPEVAPREQGTVIVFRSGTQHRVTPLESGERLALVCFFGHSPRGRS